MGLFHLIILATLAAYVHGTFVSCGGGAIDKVTVGDVDASTVDQSILKKGTNATLHLHFTSTIASVNSTSSCEGIILGVPVKFPVEPNGCLGMNPKCPITANTAYTFSTTIPVQTIDPNIGLLIKWQETAANGQPIVCVVIKAKIEG